MGTVQMAREWLRSAKSVLVLTGAGISAESGIPTFRSAGGLWRSYRPEQLATPEAFQENPALVWEWYDMRRKTVAAAEPNSGHYAIAAMEDRIPRFTLVTQNVDGLHRRAGSRNVLEIHGSLWTVRCLECGRTAEDRRVPLPEIPPRCACGGLLRPGVVWFGEGLDARIWHNAEQAACSSELILVVGTSAVVYPAASIAPLAKRAGARVVEINPEETPLTSTVDCVLQGPSGEILPELIA